MVANSSQMAPSKAPVRSTSDVSGRVTNSVTTSPPTRQPKVASHNDQASRVRLRTRMGTIRDRVTAQAGRSDHRAPTVRDRYGRSRQVLRHAHEGCHGTRVRSPASEG